MGQTFGKAQISSDALPFVSLPGSRIVDLRKSVNEVAEGYGLTLVEVQDIIRISLREFLRIPESTINDASKSLFNLFREGMPVQSNNASSLIDSFGFLAAMCIISSMELQEKVLFVFSLYDFDESGRR